MGLQRIPTTLMLLSAGLALLLHWIPTGAMATGPRIGMGILLITMALLVFGLANAAWFLRLTTRPEDYRGGCPAGQACEACGAFNLKPRSTCRSCGGPVNASEAL